MAQRSVKRVWVQIEECFEVFCDSQSGISLSKNNVHNERKNHADVKFHKIWQVIGDGLEEDIYVE